VITDLVVLIHPKTVPVKIKLNPFVSKLTHSDRRVVLELQLLYVHLVIST
jgi:hypothetical protein